MRSTDAAHPRSLPGRTFISFGYGDLTARSMFGSLDYFFPLPAGQEPAAGSALDLVVSHSPLLVADRSTMTVIVNGQSVTSTFLTPRNRDHAHVLVSLPVQGFHGTGYFVQIRFLLRLTHDPCEQVQDPALWATIHGNSLLRLGVHSTGKGLNLRDLDALFTTSAGTSSTLQTSIVLPRRPTAAEIGAAGLAAFQVGRWAAKAEVDPRINLARTAPGSQASITAVQGSGISRVGGWHSTRWTGGAFRLGTSTAKGGLLGIKGSAYPQILVAGASANALDQAARALVDSQERKRLGGQYALVQNAPSDEQPPYAWQAGGASFAQLGVDAQQIVGPGEHDIDLNFYRPAGWLLSPGSALNLDVLSSPALRRATSWIDVSVNGKDFGARRLENDQGVARRYHFVLPVDALNTDTSLQPLRQLSLHVRMFLDIPQGNCIEVPTDSAWTSILPSSSWLLPHSDYIGLDVGRFPAPFTDLSGNGVSVVLPDQPTDRELTAGLEVLAAMGRWTIDPNPTVRLVTASALSQKDRAGQDLVLVGGRNRNSLTAAAVHKESSVAPMIQPSIGDVQGNSSYGELHLSRSPWASARTVLVLQGSSDVSLGLDGAALDQSKVLGQMRGQTVALADNLPAQTLQPAQPQEPSPASLAPQVAHADTASAPGPPAWQIVGGILLVAFLVAIALVLFRLFRGSAATSGGSGG